MYTDIADNLRIGNNCILDATNINTKDRKKAFDSIDSILRNKFNFKYGFPYRKIAIVCLAGVSICIERDSKRERSVGEKVIKKPPEGGYIINVDNYEKVCKIYQENSFLLEVDVTSDSGEIFSYKIPLKLEDNCST